MIPSINLASDSLGLGAYSQAVASLFGKKKDREANMKLAEMNYDLQKQALANSRIEQPVQQANNTVWYVLGAIILLVIIISISRR